MIMEKFFLNEEKILERLSSRESRSLCGGTGVDILGDNCIVVQDSICSAIQDSVCNIPQDSTCHNIFNNRCNPTLGLGCGVVHFGDECVLACGNPPVYENRCPAGV